ncbi:hypothetical protein Tsubulata_037947 [Turnera subulata]|uniref:S-adenosyl-L-methionine-dependent methyltransferase n=1 Tax=Turnera subulata TaxID=218843 RepID=A0A9Q0FFD8_9ROSI|nr:hypothetical protein Tsubulata_037947 [Turnera subulata]
MEWSPHDAMKAYLQTLELCKEQSKENTSHGASTSAIEPKCPEFVSALAAGKQARLIVEISSEGITPLTIALSVAAKHSGGRLVCIISHQEGQQKKNTTHSPDHDFEDVIEVVYGNDPEGMIMQYKNIDFAVIDGKLEFHPKFLERISVNPRGSIIVRHNLHCREHGVMSVGDYVCNANKGVECVTLPIGEGMELTRIGPLTKRDYTRGPRYKRFHVTFEN